jgi:uncharacterized protein YpuA (DUF1002 family)
MTYWHIVNCYSKYKQNNQQPTNKEEGKTINHIGCYFVKGKTFNKYKFIRIRKYIILKSYSCSYFSLFKVSFIEINVGQLCALYKFFYVCKKKIK